MARKKRKPLATRRLSYAFVLAAGFACAFFFGGTVVYTVFFLCILLPVLSLLQLLAARRYLSCGAALDAEVVQKNQRFRYQVRLRNLSPLFTLPALRAELPSPKEGKPPIVRSALSLLPGQSLKLGFSLSYPYRGLYVLPPPRVRTSDLLGLCWLPLLRPPAPATVKVRPRVHALDGHGLFSGRRPSSPRRSAVVRNEATTSSDSRLYQYGDPLNRIHWKLTAQKNELIARQFESEEDSEFLLLLDAAPPPPGSTSALEAADRLVECVLAVLFDCLQSDRPVRLLHGGAEGFLYEARQHDRASFDALLDHLTVLPFDGAPPLYQIARRVTGGESHRFIGAAAFTASLTEETLAAMAALHAPDCPAAVVYVSPDEEPPVFDAPPLFDVRVVPPGADIKAAMSASVAPRPAGGEDAP